MRAPQLNSPHLVCALLELHEHICLHLVVLIHQVCRWEKTSIIKFINHGRCERIQAVHNA